MKTLDDPRIVVGMRRQMADRRRLLDRGEVPLGWKLGCNPPAFMAKLAIEKPLTGSLLKSGLVPSGAEVPLKGWIKPVADPEIAVHLCKDVPGGADRATVVAAIGGLGPAIELGDIQFMPDADSVEAVLAANIFQRHVILGVPDMTRGANVDGLEVLALRNGVEVGRTSDPERSIGNILDLVRHLADMLAAFGERLRAGEVIITGSPFPLIFVGPADSFVHRLDPLGEVSVRFTH
jgi:2-keto-4-pentenoate hydratase